MVNFVNANDVTIATTKHLKGTEVQSGAIYTLQDFAQIDEATGGQNQLAESQVITSAGERPVGEVVAIEAAFGINSETTFSMVKDFFQTFYDIVPTRQEVIDIAVGAVTAGGYTPTTNLTASQIAKLPAGSLIHVTGSQHSVNNGLQVLSGPATANSIPVAGRTVESNANIAIDGSGFRTATTSKTWTWSAQDETATLALTGIGTSLMACGLEVGQRVVIGSPGTGNTVNNAMTRSGMATNGAHGSAVVRSITADAVVFQDVDPKMRYTISGISTAMDILFSTLIRKRVSGDTGFQENVLTVVQRIPGLNPDPNYYRVITGNEINTMSMTVGTRAFSTMDYRCIGRRSLSGYRDTGSGVDRVDTEFFYNHANAIKQRFQNRFNNSNKLGRISLDAGGAAGALSSWREFTLNFTNNKRGIGELGTPFNAAVARGATQFSLTGEINFTNDSILKNVEDSDQLKFTNHMANDEGAFFIDSYMRFTEAVLLVEQDDLLRYRVAGQGDPENRFNTAVRVSEIFVPGLQRRLIKAA